MRFSDKRFEGFAFVAIFIAVWAPVELLTAIYLRRHKKLNAIQSA
jgi:hypothetical protein